MNEYFVHDGRRVDIDHDSFPTTDKRPLREKRGSTVITEKDAFMALWKAMLETMTSDEVDHWVSQVSPLHPNPNMVWLHDRLLMKKAGIA